LRSGSRQLIERGPDQRLLRPLRLRSDKLQHRWRTFLPGWHRGPWGCSPQLPRRVRRLSRSSTTSDDSSAGGIAGPRVIDLGCGGEQPNGSAAQKETLDTPLNRKPLSEGDHATHSRVANSTSSTPSRWSLMKPTITSLGGRAPPGRNTPSPSSGSRWRAASRSSRARPASSAIAPRSSVRAACPDPARPLGPSYAASRRHPIFSAIDNRRPL
jgi:hypothetical protein